MKTEKGIRYLSLDDELPFGKHEGKTIQELIIEEPSYLIWMAENLNSWKFDNEAWRIIETFIEE